MKYKSGYKYQLVRDEVFEDCGIYPPEDIKTRFINLTTKGRLTCRAWYAWDGPSGPTYDTENSMTPSLAHDALAQLMRMGLLSRSWRLKSNEFFDRLLKERGMWWPRRWYWINGLDWFGASSTDPKNTKPVLFAP